MKTPGVLFSILLAASFAQAQAPEQAGPAAIFRIALNAQADDSLMARLTRTPWTWETVRGKSVIQFDKDGTCHHTRFNGTFSVQKDGSILVNMQSRPEILFFDFAKDEFTGNDPVLQQKIIGRRKAPAPDDPQAIYDAQMEKLTRTPWLWETAMGPSTISFAKDRTCVHTHFNGTFEIQPDDTVTIKMPTREQVLVYNFARNEFTAYDTTLKQRINGRRVEPK